jgi:hypothetical protein
MRTPGCSAHRPAPLRFRYRYLGSWEGNITQADVTAASVAIGNGLPLPWSPVERNAARAAVWTVRSDATNLGRSAGAAEGVEDKIVINSGEGPRTSKLINGDGTSHEIPVLL